MLPYVIVTGSIALLSILMPGRRVAGPPWVVAFLGIAVFVGLRHHVGMDWNNYLIMIQRASVSAADAMVVAEPLYAVVLHESAAFGYGVYGANLVVAAIMMLGLFRYARTTPNPWLALLVALPFLVIVVGMSANRQAAAIGVMLWAVASWDRYPMWRRALLIAIAAGFHASALMFIIFIAADIRLPRVAKSIVMLAAVAAGFYALDRSGRLDYYDSIYVSGQSQVTESSGAIFHTMLNGAPAALYFLMRRYRNVLLPNTLHRQMALMALGLVPLSLFSSAAAGRITLYLFPVSIYFFSALPVVIRDRRVRGLYRSFCALGFTSLVVLWLTTANSAVAHVPYENFLTIPSTQRQLCC